MSGLINSFGHRLRQAGKLLCPIFALRQMNPRLNREAVRAPHHRAVRDGRLQRRNSATLLQQRAGLDLGGAHQSCW